MKKDKRTGRLVVTDHDLSKALLKMIGLDPGVRINGKWIRERYQNSLWVFGNKTDKHGILVDGGEDVLVTHACAVSMPVNDDDDQEIDGILVYGVEFKEHMNGGTTATKAFAIMLDKTA